LLPRVSLREAASSSSADSSEDASSLAILHGGSEENEGSVAVRTSIKRDSEGVPVVREPVTRNGSNKQTNPGEPEREEDVVNEGGLTAGQEQRRLRVIEETSFDLDKVRSRWV
jgi:hypothetical protein